LPKGRNELPIFPLGLAQIAAGLGRHSVAIYDLQLFSHPLAIIGKIMRQERPDLVGVSLIAVDSSASYDKFYYFDLFVSCIREIKKAQKGAATVTGGPGFTLFAEEIMKKVPEIDFGIPFEGEETMAELIENLDRPQAVTGLYYRKGGNLFFTGKRDPLDIDRLPPPRIEHFNLDDYRGRAEQIGVQTKRGCIFRCLYCTYPYLGGRKIRMRSVGKVVDEIEELSKNGIDKIFICDSIFNYPPEHAAGICREILRRKIKIKWKAFFNEHFLNRELVDLATKAGCELFIFGPDGSHSRTLKKINKNFSIADMKRAYALVKKASGARFKCAFMFNGPGETVTTFFATLKWVLNLIRSGRFEFSISNIRIYPHTGLYRLAINRGLIREGTSLIIPRYYNPYPLRLISYFLNITGTLLYRLIRLIRRDNPPIHSPAIGKRCIYLHSANKPR